MSLYTESPWSRDLVTESRVEIIFSTCVHLFFHINFTSRMVLYCRLKTRNWRREKVGSSELPADAITAPLCKVCVFVSVCVHAESTRVGGLG